MSPRLIRSGAFAAFGAALLLGWQFLIARGFSDDISLLSKSVDPARMTTFFQADARPMTHLMAADDGFAIAYALAFVALAAYLMPRARLLGTLAFVFALGTALTDLSENSLYLAAVETVSQNQPLPGGMLVVLFWLGQIKYLSIYLAALLFAIGVWEAGAAGRIFAILLLLFPVIGIVSIAIEALMLVKVLWMLVLLIAGGVFLLLARHE